MQRRPTTAEVRRGGTIKPADSGAVVGDVLDAGPHCFHARGETEGRDGEWVDDYAAALLAQYQAGIEPRQSSQVGRETVMLLESVADCWEYDAGDCHRRFREFCHPSISPPPNLSE